MKRTRPSLLQQVAASVDLPARLLHCAPELFADLPSLGSSPRRLVGLLRRAQVRPGAGVIDLACGKGSASIALARQLACSCRGVDAFAPFIAEATIRARRAAVGDRTTFITGDIAALPRAWRGTADVAIMLGLWPVERAAPLLRSLVRPGGLYVLDDAVFVDAADGPTRVDAQRHFARLGDTLVVADVVSPSRMRLAEASLRRRIAMRARKIAARNPRLGPALREFVASQRRSARLLAGPLRAVVWVVRKGG